MIGGVADMQKWVAIFNLVNSNSPPPPALIPPGGIYLPVVTAVQGLTSATVVLDTDGINPIAKFFGNAKSAGNILECTLKLDVTTDNTSVQRQLSITVPSVVAINFQYVGQAEICGLPSIVKTPGSEGNTGSGWNGNLVAIPSTNTVLFAFETSELSTQYFIDLTFKYIVPPYAV